MDALGRSHAGKELATGESWRQSGSLEALPRLSLTDLLESSTRIVVISPHPDDEVLGAGGLISEAGAHGIDISVVSVTDGEHCYPGNPFWPAQRLRDVRRSELDAALRALDLDHPHVSSLGIPDGSVSAHEKQLEEFLDSYLKYDDRVLAPWVRDGHPDHEAVSRATSRACMRSGSRLIQFPIWAWHGIPMDRHGMSPRGLTRFEMSERAHLRKVAGTRCFTSQIAVGDPTIPAPVLPPSVLSPFLRPYEVFIHG